MKYIYIVFCVFLCFAGCKSAKLDGPERYIYFGSGGGITGKSNVFRVSSYGKLENVSADASSSLMTAHLTHKTLKNMFTLADSVQKNIALFGNPGNIYYFISIKKDVDEGPDYMWGQTGFIAPEPIIRLYNMLEKIQTSAKTPKK